MNYAVLERQALTSSFGKTPYGFILPNGVVVIYQEGKNVHNMSTLAHALAICPDLVVLNSDKKVDKIEKL